MFFFMHSFSKKVNISQFLRETLLKSVGAGIYKADSLATYVDNLKTCFM